MKYFYKINKYISYDNCYLFILHVKCVILLYNNITLYYITLQIIYYYLKYFYLLVRCNCAFY